MSALPTITDYQDVLQSPQTSFTDPILKTHFPLVGTGVPHEAFPAGRRGRILTQNPVILVEVAVRWGHTHGPDDPLWPLF